MLHGERPYWWVHETDVYNRTGHGTAPSIRQYSLTCETGPGSPSGHAMVSAAIWYIILDFAMRRTGCAQQVGKAWACSFHWCAYTALLCVVSLSRVYIAAHFPHQCLMGMVIGECVLPSSSHALQYRSLVNRGALEGKMPMSVSLGMSFPLRPFVVGTEKSVVLKLRK